MKLMLKVISDAGDEINSITLENETITIGRNSSNTLVLEDPKKFISGQHAIIDCQNTEFFVKDISTNGVVINNSAQPIGNGGKAKLNDGDQLRIGDYTVVISQIKEQQSIDAGNTLSMNESFDFADDPFAELDSDPVQEMINENQWETPFEISENQSISKPLNNLDVDIFDFGKKNDEYISNVEQPAGIKEAFQPFSVEKKQQDASSESDLFGEDWFTKEAGDIDEAITEPSSHETGFQEASTPIDNIEKKPELELPNEIPIQPSTVSTEVDSQTAQLIESFLRGAGLENAEMNDALTAESFFIIGKVLRTSIQGTMDVLIGRAKIKNEMHLDVTMIRSKENNPVKFSVSAEEAIKKLLDPQDAGYLSAEDAIEEVFGDILAHQFSVIAGMQTALLEVLKRFNPQKLEQRFQQQNPISSSIPIHKQAKLWNSFELLYKDIEHEATDNFYHLFGQAFAESYEQQIIELKNARKNSPF